MATGPDTVKSTPLAIPKRSAFRRYIIPTTLVLAIAVPAGMLAVNPDIIQDGKSQIRRLLKQSSKDTGRAAAREVVDRTFNRLQWEEIARCTITGTKQPGVVKVIRRKRLVNVSSLRSIKIEVYRNGASEPTEIMTRDAGAAERKAPFRSRVINEAQSLCGGAKIQILDLK